MSNGKYLEMVSLCGMASVGEDRAQKAHATQRQNWTKKPWGQIAAHLFRIILFGHKFSHPPALQKRDTKVLLYTIGGKETERGR